MSQSLIPPAPPEVVRLTPDARVVWNNTFPHKCQPTDLLTVEDVLTANGVDCKYLVQMISRTDQLWMSPELVIGMRWIGFNNWEEIK